MRIQLIQQLSNLSGERTEFQLLDRLRFQRLADLPDTSRIRDRTTIWTFKERLIKACASESVIDAVKRQLAKHGDSAGGGQTTHIRAKSERLWIHDNSIWVGDRWRRVL